MQRSRCEVVGVAQVGDDVAPMSIHRQVIGRILTESRRGEFAHRIAEGPLDLDHVSAQVARDHRAERAGQYPREVEDAHALERQARADVGRVDVPAH